VAYKKEQWIESFEGKLSFLRPHLTARILETMSLQAWHQFCGNSVDPVDVARELSKLLDKSATAVCKKP
jgi:hypothetical protein